MPDELPQADMQLQTRQRAPLSATLRTLPRLLHPVRGPILSLQKQPVESGDPLFAHVHAWAGGAPYQRGRPSRLRTGGSALTWPVAIAKAMGESVERSSVLQWEPPVLLACANTLDAHADLAACDGFHADQRAAPGFTYKPVDECSLIGWVPAYSLTRRLDGFVPATLAHFYYTPRTAADTFDTCPVSGYACGNSLEEALLGALCEVVERDALMIAWYQRLAVPSLDLASLTSAEAREALRRFSRSPVRLYCSDISTDIGIPAVLVMMTSQAPGWPAAAVATAADLSVEHAVVKALGELSSAHWLLRASHGRSPAMHEVQEPQDHGLYYAQPSALPHLDRFLHPRSTRRVAPEAPAADDPAGATATATPREDVLVSLDIAVQRLAARGLEAWAVELTAPLMATEGLHVVKVIVPGMQPLDFGSANRHLGGKRLYAAPVAMGYQALASSPAGLNPVPHPFP